MEELKIELKEKLGFNSPVIGYLASIIEGAYSYNYYRLRHPGGIFNLQFGDVVDDFLDLLTHLKELQNNQTVGMNLDKKFSSLLWKFFKYYESCYEIILGCCKKHEVPSEKEPIHKWLKKEPHCYLAGEYFFQKVNNDISFFRDMVNKLKHTSNTIRIIIDFHGTKLPLTSGSRSSGKNQIPVA